MLQACGCTATASEEKGTKVEVNQRILLHTILRECITLNTSSPCTSSVWWSCARCDRRLSLQVRHPQMDLVVHVFSLFPPFTSTSCIHSLWPSFLSLRFSSVQSTSFRGLFHTLGLSLRRQHIAHLVPLDIHTVRASRALNRFGPA